MVISPRVWVAVYSELYAAPLERHLGQLEAFLARHWPELDRVVEIRDRISLLRWLGTYIDPATVRAAPAAATAALHHESRGSFRAPVVAAIVQSAQGTQGVPMTAPEARLGRALVGEIVRLRTACDGVETAIDTHLAQNPAHAPLCALLAPVTTAVVLALVGDPATYASAAAFEKACGLNLKERSSGTHKGELHLTKRGPGLVRKYLFLAALRLIARDPWVRAWYERRAGYQPTHKLRAVIAVVRKLTKALWHVARGAAFEVTKLFDRARLTPAAAAAGGAPTT